MEKYSCLKCANVRSPLCGYCTVFETPSGNAQKPKYFVAYTKIGVCTEGHLPTLLRRSLDEGRSLPLHTVMAYNDELEKNADG